MINLIKAETIQLKYINYFGIEIGWEYRSKIPNRLNISDDPLIRAYEIVIEDMKNDS